METGSENGPLRPIDRNLGVSVNIFISTTTMFTLEHLRACFIKRFFSTSEIRDPQNAMEFCKWSF